MGLLDTLTKGIFGDAAQVKSNQDAADLFGSVLGNLGEGAEQSLPLALKTLQDILGRGGKIDPRRKLRAIQAARRGAQGQQQNVQRSFARRGLSNSGVGQAIQAALGFAGEGKVADLEGQFAIQEEQFARQDINQGLGAFVNPGLNVFGIERGVDQFNAQVAQSQQNAVLSALGAVGGGFAGK